MNKHPSSLTNPATENFTANAKAAALLRQISLESLGVKADISQKVMGAYRLGNQEITNEHKDAICNVLGLSADVLTEVYPEEECQDRLRAAFSAAGVVLSEIETTNVTVDADIAQDFSREGIQETLPQDVGDDESIVAQQSTESAAIRWRGDVAWIEGKSFDLSDKAVRRTVCQHIRVAKGKLTIKALIEAATPNRNKSTWLGSVENGLSRMTPEELQSIAREVNTPVAVLFTGQGLDLTKLRKRKKSKVAEDAIVLPSFTDEAWLEFFRGRVLNRSVELAEGVSAGELLELAGKPHDDVDWDEVWLNKTKLGQSLNTFIEKADSQLNKLALPLQVLVLRRLLDRFQD